MSIIEAAAVPADAFDEQCCVLLEEIPAIELIPSAAGETRFGPISKLPKVPTWNVSVVHATTGR